MDRDVPRSLVLAARFQLLSGLVNVALLPTILIVGANVCGTLTYGIGSLCGLGVLLVAPVGILEIGISLWAMTAPREAAEAMRWLTWAELLAVAGGALHAGVVGWTVAHMIEQPEVLAFLDDVDAP